MKNHRQRHHSDLKDSDNPLSRLAFTAVGAGERVVSPGYERRRRPFTTVAKELPLAAELRMGMGRARPERQNVRQPLPHVEVHRSV